MAATVSVSKGVFAFKRRNNDKIQKYSKKMRREEQTQFWPAGNDSLSSIQQQNFNVCWTAISDKLQALESEIHQTVFKDLVEFVSKQYSHRYGCSSSHSTAAGGTMFSIPAAVLVTGVNMPDSGQALTNLTDQLVKEEAASHIVRLHSRNCINIKNCIVSLVSQLVNPRGEVDSDSDIESDSDEVVNKASPKKKTSTVKKTNCNMTVLEAWHKEQLKDDNGGNIVVMLEDCESFSTSVLQDFIQIISHHPALPVMLVLCVATSPAALHSRLSQPVLACLSITTFQARPSHHYLATLVDKVLMDANCTSFRLGGKPIKILIDMFLYHHLSVNTFVQGLKYCVLEHFLSQSVTVLCCPSSRREALAAKLSAHQLEAFRKLPSFRQYVDGLPNKEKTFIFDDEKTKKCVLLLLSNLDSYYCRLCCVVRVLHQLAANVPNAPLGRQVWSLLSLCLNGTVVESAEFNEVWQHLENLSRVELVTPLLTIIALLGNSGHQNLKESGNELQELLEDLFNMEESAEQKFPDEDTEQTETLQPTNRFELKEKLMELSKKKQQGKLNKFQILRKDILAVIKDLVVEHAVPPTTQPLHEVLFFHNSAEVSSRLLGKHRASITRGLSDPSHYLQCECCCNNLSSSLPDLSVVYRLHLECGRLINLYDWLNAFCSLAEQQESESEEEDQENQKKKKNKSSSDQSQPDSILQARFVQAVSELQFLGFIKTSKRKTDHVARLTWGGC
uniref:Origin recognition complex subunit 3 n=1 Tax=Hirondellea gigas TaxID=1518452 RepID=A0A2P2I1E0_9CRUS